jgi:hypothetical protein
MPAANPLQAAYDRTALQREGISFEAAIADPMFKKCLQRIAQASEHIKQPPLPRRQVKQAWLPYKDNP